MTLRLVTDESQWTDLLTRAPAPHVTQSYAFGEGKRANGWRMARSAFVQRGKVIAICQIQERTVAGIRVASRVSRGPLFLDSAPEPADVLEVLRLLRKGWGRVLTGPLLIAPALHDNDENRELLRLAGYHSRSAVGWCSARLDLQRPEEQIFASFSSSFRNRYRRAEKQGVTFEVSNSVDAVQWLVKRNSDKLSALGVGHNDVSFYNAVSQTAGDAFFVIRAKFQGEFVGGTALIRSGRVTEYNIGWHSPAARDLNLGNYLMWKAICETKRRGSDVFDVGGLSDDKGGFSRFKREMPGTEYRLVGEQISIRLPFLP